MRAIITRLVPAVMLAAVILFAAALVLRQGSIAQAQSLAWGSTGNEVSVVQQKLKQWGYYHGFVDGRYGSATYSAVVNFQRRNGLRADGVVGPNTLAALGINTVARDVPPASDDVSRGFVETSRDIQLLARVIEAEAADESYSGKVAVGAVILNRVKSPAFPKTLSGVVFQPHAFESVSNGQINRPLTKESIQAARQAMAGWDPSGGATFFWNPSKPVSAWIWSRSIITRIGNHVFAR